MLTHSSHSGSTLVEAALLISLLMLVCLASVQALGYRVGCLFQLTNYALQRPDRSMDELRAHLPGISTGDQYIECQAVLGP